jgi:hypothetical protein
MSDNKKKEDGFDNDNVIKIEDYLEPDIEEYEDGEIGFEFDEELIEKMGLELTDEDLKNLADSFVQGLFGNPDDETN